jgi:hypothetical protein
VQQFGEGLSQAVGQRLGHDRVVIIVIAVEPRAKLFQADAGRDGEAAYVIDPPALARRYEVGQGLIVLAGAFLALLAQRVEYGQNARTLFVRVNFDVVACRIGRPETVDGMRPQFSAVDDAFEQGLSVFVKFTRLRAGRRIVQNAREDNF